MNKNKELNKIILNKVQNKIAISNFEKEDKEKMIKNKRIIKMVATFVISIGITIGVAYAGYNVYEKIFKEPKKYSSYDELLQDIEEKHGEKEITNEEKESSIDINKARDTAKEMLKKLGYENEEFVEEDLKKNYVAGADIIYLFSTSKEPNKGIDVAIDSKKGNTVMFRDLNLKYENITPDTITKEEATNKANEILELFNLSQNEYKLKTIEVMPYYFQGKGVDMWYVTYTKTYDGAFNYFERFETSFMIKNGKVMIEQATIANDDIEFENNPIVISKEEAVKIAKEKDKKLTDNEIESINTALEIRQVNSWIYVLEQNGGKYPPLKQEEGENGEIIYYPEYQVTQDIARKVWVVNIHYKKGEIDPNNEKKYNSKSIFVDVTTGEIVGGADESYLE